MRHAISVLTSSLIGAVLGTLVAGWIYPCLGTARWEQCAEGIESDPSTFSLPICSLGVCDLSFSLGEKLIRAAVVLVLLLAVATSAAYFSRSHKAWSAGAAIALVLVFLSVLIPNIYPHGYRSQ